MTKKSAPVQVHEWGNALFSRTEPVTEDEVRTLWADDASMIMNGQVKCAGIPALVKHFEELRAKLKRAQVQLPYLITIATGNEIAARYIIDIEHTDGTKDLVHVGAFFKLAGGKIRSMDEVAWFEKKEIALDKH